MLAMLGESVWEKGMKMDFSGNDEVFYSQTLHSWARYFEIDNLLYWSKYDQSFMKINGCAIPIFLPKYRTKVVSISGRFQCMCVWCVCVEGGTSCPPLLDPSMYGSQMYYCHKHSHSGEKKLWKSFQTRNEIWVLFSIYTFVVRRIVSVE